MTRFFHGELDTLRSQLVLMGEKANAALRKGIRSLAERDISLAESVIEEDKAIDALEIEIDREATRYLTLRSPVASDLRLITVAIKASHDLERVGDEARNIAKRTRKMLLNNSGPSELINIPRRFSASFPRTHGRLTRSSPPTSRSTHSTRPISRP